MKSKIVILVISMTFFLRSNSQSVAFTHIPAWGSSENLKGKVTGINPGEYKALVFLYFEGGWWVKPYSVLPFTSLQSDNTFTCNVNTGGADIYAGRYIAFLVPKNFQEGSGFDVADLKKRFPFAYYCRKPGKRTIRFSGISWTVKSMGNFRVGPNSNLFTDSNSNVFTDQEGALHLKIICDKTADVYRCAEVVADTSFGYGTYRFIVRSRLDSLDKNVVFSPFTWDEYADEDYFSEIDFMEASTWGEQNGNNMQYVVQPWNVSGNRHRFTIGPDENTLHETTWTKDSVLFKTMKKDGTLIHSWVYRGDIPKPGRENIRINLWLNSADKKPSLPQEDIEIVISEATFQSLLPAPVIRAGKGEADKVVLTWESKVSNHWYRIYRGASEDPVMAKPISGWIPGITQCIDTTGDQGSHYYYFVRCSDNPEGSNNSGLASGYSHPAEGWSKGQVAGIQTAKSPDFLVYPNPTTGLINVSSIKDATRNFSISIYNGQGSVVQQEDLNEKNEILMVQPPGTYLLKFREDGKTIESRIVLVI